MGIIARLKQIGGTGRAIPTLTAAATLTIQPDTSVVLLSGSTNITSISMGQDITPGRTITLRRTGTDIPTFTNTPGTTTAGQTDFGMTGTTFQLTDSVTLQQTNTGSFCRAASPFN